MAFSHVDTDFAHSRDHDAPARCLWGLHDHIRLLMELFPTGNAELGTFLEMENVISSTAVFEVKSPLGNICCFN